MTLEPEIAAEIQKLDPSSMIELFELDATDLGGDVFRFHNGTNKLRQNIVWQGEEYVRFPIQVTGFEISGQGQFPRPVVTVSNIMGAMTNVLLQYNDLVGAKFTRKRTLLKFLDAVNFPDEINPTADPEVKLLDDVYFVDRKTFEDAEAVNFELSSAADLQGVKLPLRVVTKATCPWVYRGVECGYTGVALFDERDETLPEPTSPEAIAARAAYDAVKAAQVALATAQATLVTKTNAYQAAQVYTITKNYNYIPGTEPNPPFAGSYYVAIRQVGGIWTAAQYASWNGALVTLGTTYVIGAYKETASLYSGTWLIYEIHRYLRDEAALATALSQYNTAVTNRDAAQVAVADAISDLEDALAAVPVDDPVYSQDRCGKRLNSCRIRFNSVTPNSPLPFGGFPGVYR